MPNITEYDPTVPAIRPSETGVESQAAAGRRISGFYSQIAGGLTEAGTRIARGLTEAGDAAVRYEDHKEIAAGGASGAQLFADQLEKKDAAIKAIDPNDPQYGQKVEVAVKQWREQQLEPALDQWQSQFTTQRAQEWALSHANGVRQTMFVHSTADIANAAGVGIHNSARTLVNTGTTTVFQHPEMLDSQIDLVDHGLTGLVQSTPVKGVEAARIQSETMERAKEQLVKSAVQGAIMRGGNWQQIARDPRYAQYVNASEMAQFERAERGQARFNLAQEKSIQLYNRQLATESFKAETNDLWTKYHHVTPEGQEYYDPQYGTELNALVGKYGNVPGADTIIGAHLRRFEGIVNGRKGLTNQAVYGDLKDRLNSPDNPTTETQVVNAEADALAGKPGIETRAGSILKEAIRLRDASPLKKDPQFAYAAEWAKQQIEASYGGPKYSEGKIPAFMIKFLNDYNAADATAKRNALNVNDSKSLIRQSMDNYMATLSGAIANNGGGPAPLPVYTAPTSDQMTRAREQLKRRLEDTAAPIPRAEM